MKHLEKQTLAVWTDVHVAVDGNSEQITKISYDVAYRDEYGCHYIDGTEKWKVSKNLLPLPWPYWAGCDCTFKLEMYKILICNVTL